jgi:hypothetical protein
MAKQTINIGSIANDGTGDSLRDGADKINDNINELYNLLGDGSALSISGDVTMSAGAVTIANSAVENSMMAANSVDSDQYVDGSIDTVHIADSQVTAAKIADNNITHDKLENRYTVLSALGSGTSFALDFSAATTFTATASGNATFTFSNAKQGQVIDLILTGNYTITFSQTNGTFNKVGSTDYDGSANNLVQIVCTDDSANPVYMYSIGTYVSDPTP